MSTRFHVDFATGGGRTCLAAYLVALSAIGRPRLGKLRPQPPAYTSEGSRLGAELTMRGYNVHETVGALVAGGVREPGKVGATMFAVINRSGDVRMNSLSTESRAPA